MFFNTLSTGSLLDAILLLANEKHKNRKPIIYAAGDILQMYNNYTCGKQSVQTRLALQHPTLSI